ncbi:hypothetical protein HPB47_006280 [Ixodes persulcatus]|uniref:Uncharacterized protein n=1 Tax=Ixodes persulcatus TaxID=34615 RepID=A0AC60PAN2_IXOPE|nr:hypothetical protein HPB47_006280 [Ixodes persulcatus]
MAPPRARAAPPPRGRNVSPWGTEADPRERGRESFERERSRVTSRDRGEDLLQLTPLPTTTRTLLAQPTGSRLDLDPVATRKWTTAAILGASQACSHQRRASENPGGVCFRSPKERQRERRCGGKSSGDVQARAGGGEGDRLKLQAV